MQVSNGGATTASREVRKTLDFIELHFGRTDAEMLITMVMQRNNDDLVNASLTNTNSINEFTFNHILSAQKRLTENAVTIVATEQKQEKNGHQMWVSPHDGSNSSFCEKSHKKKLGV